MCCVRALGALCDPNGHADRYSVSARATQMAQNELPSAFVWVAWLEMPSSFLQGKEEPSQGPGLSSSP
jgi:hypothetical protein